MLTVPTHWFSRLPPVFGFKIITELSSPEDSPYLEINKLSNRPHTMPLSPQIATYIRIYLSPMAVTGWGITTWVCARSGFSRANNETGRRGPRPTLLDSAKFFARVPVDGMAGNWQ
jgi:hypothetical protein